jgi:hypothetical protein
VQSFDLWLNFPHNSQWILPSPFFFFAILSSPLESVHFIFFLDFAMATSIPDFFLAASFGRPDFFPAIQSGA